MNLTDDLDAIRRLKKGDLRALELLMTRYQVRATRAAFLITYDEALAEDVVQDAFLRIQERIGQYHEERPFEPYLLRTVIHASLNAVRKQTRIVPAWDNANDLERLLDRAASVESQVEFGELQRDILTALSKLPPRQRAVIVQRYYLEMSERDMAQASKTAVGTIKWMLNAARERLRALLGEKGVSND